jgi:ubiquinone/menaquinone biosynthesis C-methylase UbiE
MSDDAGYGPSTYGDRIADVYDAMYQEVPFSGDVSTTVDFLASLAGTGPALELGIGTGKVAIPLVAAGVDVHGIDASEAMIDSITNTPSGRRCRATAREHAS